MTRKEFRMLSLNDIVYLGVRGDDKAKRANVIGIDIAAGQVAIQAMPNVAFVAGQNRNSENNKCKIVSYRRIMFIKHS